MDNNMRSAEHHLRKARSQFRNVKDKDLADALRRLTTGLLRLEEEIRALKKNSN